MHKIRLEDIFLWTLYLGFAIFMFVCLSLFWKYAFPNKRTEQKTCETYTINDYLAANVPYECITKTEEVLSKFNRK